MEKDFTESILKNPYESILEWSCKRFKGNVGKKVFRYLALSPVSIIMPEIPYEDSNKNTSINVLLFTPSGGSKSIVADAFEEIAFNPYRVKDVTPAKLQSDLKNRDIVSLIIEDAYLVFKDPNLMKILEGIIADGRVDKKRMSYDDCYKIKGCSYVAAVPTDVSKYLQSGLLFRVSPIVIMHSFKQQREIGKEIVKSIGSKANSKVSSKDIKDYYIWLYKCQEGYDKQNPPITGYVFDGKIKKKLYDSWVKCLKLNKAPKLVNWYRELVRGFCYLGALAILNRPNRKIDNGLITPSEEDVNNAIDLMAEEIHTKVVILASNEFTNHFSDMEHFKRASIEKDFSKDTINFLEQLMISKLGAN